MNSITTLYAVVDYNVKANFNYIYALCTSYEEAKRNVMAIGKFSNLDTVRKPDSNHKVWSDLPNVQSAYVYSDGIIAIYYFNQESSQHPDNYVMY